jgi:hypothetical protein
MSTKPKPPLQLHDVLERVANSSKTPFSPRDAARYEANLAVGIIASEAAPLARQHRDALLRQSYLERIKAYAPYQHADAVPLAKSEAWLS